MNARRVRLPLGVVALAAVLALAAIGVVYGLWSRTLDINGTVNTGNVDAVWFFDSCNFVNNPKDVATVEVIPSPDQQTLTVNVNNAYPNLLLDCELHVANTGTIPISFVSTSKGANVIGPDSDSDPGTSVKVALVDSVPQISPCAATKQNVTYGTFPTGPPTGCQTAFSLLVEVNQAAVQNETYSFAFELCYHQFNKSPTLQLCQDEAKN